MVTFQHVYSHTGQHNNECVGWAANFEAERKVGEQLRRWAEPPPVLPAPPEVVKDYKCPKCGAFIPTSESKWHVRFCAGGEPATSRQARAQEMQRTSQVNHEVGHKARCRGSAQSNRTCIFCGEVFEASPAGGLSRDMRNHEVRCPQRHTGNAANIELAAAKMNTPSRTRYLDKMKTERAKAKSGAVAAPKTKAKSEAKAKSTPEGKGKSKARGKAKAARRPR